MKHVNLKKLSCEFLIQHLVNYFYLFFNTLNYLVMKKLIFRISNLADADLLEQARVFHGYLTEYLAIFSNFDTTINQAKLDRLALLIEQAENNLSDNVIKDRQAQLTEIVNIKMEECRNIYNTISYFFKNAFPTSAAIRNEFGENDFRKIRKTQSKMISFMQELHEVSLKYRTELVNAGAKDEYIERAGQLYTELNQANNNQELYIGKRPVLTEERIKVLNEIFEELQLISRAAKIIFMDEIAKMKLFLIPHRSKKHKDDTQHIGVGERHVSIDEGIEEDLYLKLENIGTTELVFYVADKNLVDAPESAITISPEKFDVVSTNDISNHTYGKLIVQNNTETEGTYKVKLME